MISLFKKRETIHPVLIRAPARGTVDRNALGEALCPKTTEQRKQEWRDRYLQANPELTEVDLLNLEARGLKILDKWRKQNAAA